MSTTEFLLLFSISVIFMLVVHVGLHCKNARENVRKNNTERREQERMDLWVQMRQDVRRNLRELEAIENSKRRGREEVVNWKKEGF